MDMDKTEKIRRNSTCGEFEYQVIRSARKTMTLEVRKGWKRNRSRTSPYRSAEDPKKFVTRSRSGFWDVWNGQKNTGNRSR